MNWIEEAKRVFAADKPEHFTNYTHCEECAEHDQTLKQADIDQIGLEELGNPGWDPLCFSSSEGKKYYMPALIRLSLETIHDEFYFGQLLFHLEGDGEDNKLFLSCTKEQRRLVASFIDYMTVQHLDKIDMHRYTDKALKVHQIWSMQA